MAAAMDAFFAECGGAEPLRVELSAGGGGRIGVEFRKPFVLVGRGLGADLIAGGGDAPHRQLYVQLIRGRLFAVPLAPDVPSPRDDGCWPGGWITPDDRFPFGESGVRFLNPVQPAAPPAAAHPTQPLHSGGALFALDCGYGMSRGRQVENARPLLLIGTALPSKVRIQHPSLDPVHAAVVATPGRFWVVDLSSGGGVTLDGRAVAAAPLADGDVFQCGQVPFRFTLPAGREARGPAGALRPRPAHAGTGGPQFGQDSAAFAALLDQVAQVQQQTHEQFRQMLGTVLQMVGGLMADQRSFVKEELDRMERLLLDVTRGQAPPGGPPSPAARPRAALPEPPVDLRQAPRPPDPVAPPRPDTHLHSWIESQLQSMQRQQETFWSRLKRTVTGDGPQG